MWKEIFPKCNSEARSALMLINYNGQILDEALFSIAPFNRSFLYGDGLFETIKVCKGKALFFNQHYVRFIEGLSALKMEIPESWTITSFKNQVEELTAQNGVQNARVRLTFWRAGKGRYTPENFGAEYLIETIPLQSDYYLLNTQGLNIGVFDGLTKVPGAFSEFKSANAMIYTMAGIHAKEQSLDDIIIQNIHGRPVEMQFSNFFIRKGNVLLTPAVSEGCINGVMRRVLIKLCLKSGMDVVECPLSIADVKKADEMFITNTMQGIQWVGQCGDTLYGREISGLLLAKLNEYLQDFFERQ